MTLFLTSSPTIPLNPDDPYGPFRFNTTNGFKAELLRRWKPEGRMLFVCSNPDDWDGTDQYAEKTRAMFIEEGLALSEVTVLDGRSRYLSRAAVQGYDVVFLGGGHVPTQNAFLHRVGLPEKLRGYGGIVIGCSAGSMNCAGVVYAQPEYEQEIRDLSYQRFLPGLGLTKWRVLPHFQAIRHWSLAGRRLLEDITFPDSKGRALIALNDGSYILEENGKSVVYGEAYHILNCVMTQICANGEQRGLE